MPRYVAWQCVIATVKYSMATNVASAPMMTRTTTQIHFIEQDNSQVAGAVL